MLKQRVITAFAMLFALLAAVFLLPREGWLIFVAIVVVVAAGEWAGLVGLTGAAKSIYCAATCALFIGAAYAGGLLGAGDAPSRVALLAMFGSGAVFWLVLAPVWLSGKWPLRTAGVGIVIGWLVVVPAGLALVVLRGVNPWLLLAAMAIVWVADIAAYFVGRSIGKRKLAPSISPGKSWEGAFGAVGFVVVYGFVVARVWPEWLLSAPPGLPGILGFATVLVLLTAVSIVGDLFESLAKRQAGVKDSGTILPGHGGMLDRIDSLTSTLPLVALALVWMKP